MPKSSLPWIALLVCTLAAAQDAGFEERLERGNDLLRSGDFSGALAIFDDLQVDEPNSTAVQYGRGCALYEKALAEDDPAAAIAHLNDAKAAFESAGTTAEGDAKTDAAFNRANAMAQITKQAAPQEDQKKAIEDFKNSIQSYEELLQRNPEHAKARHNLDHMRYAMKRILQNPPPPQEQQQKGDEDKQDEEGEQEQQNQDQQQQEEGEQQQQEQQPGDQQTQQDQQESDQNQDGDSPPETGEEEQQTPQGQPKAMLKQQDLARENVEALLDSLEEMDKAEQHEIREGARDHRLRKEWW